jgi:hypothetical protein
MVAVDYKGVTKYMGLSETRCNPMQPDGIEISQKTKERGLFCNSVKSPEIVARMTFNQTVPGSNPGASTNVFKMLRRDTGSADAMGYKWGS